MTSDIADPEPPPDGYEILEKLVALPVSTWTYVWEDESVRHLGPMAQDFAATFGLGSSDRHINVADAIGVLLVGLQALSRKVSELEDQVAGIVPKSSKRE